MNEITLELFRHNAWANEQLLEFCKQLDPAQLRSSEKGSVGDILETFHHIVYADANYLRRLTGNAFDWQSQEEKVGLDALLERSRQAATGWETYLQREIEPDEVYYVDSGAYATRATIIIAQAIHHGNHHREQICSILTGLGHEPPDVQAWEYAWHTGRIWDAESRS